MHRAEGGRVVRALTIAGSDSGGGAGIQADLKTMHQFGVYGTSVLTSVTAQNTLGVQGIYPVPPEFVQAQLESVLGDIGADAAKTGMLGSANVIDTVATFLRAHSVSQLVVDPVMIAKGGAPLLEDDAVATLRSQLLPLAQVVTPNLPEAEVLWGQPITTFADCHRAARSIAQSGVSVVIVKGGHAPGSLDDGRSDGGEAILPGTLPAGFDLNDWSVDLVYEQAADRFTYFAAPRVNSQRTHGTGCTYSAAITALLARGEPILQAIATAKAFVHRAIEGARDWDVGMGHGPTDHCAPAHSAPPLAAGRFHTFQGGQWATLLSQHIQS